MVSSLLSKNTIFEIEQEIKELLKGKDFWGDINLSKEEYEHLKNKLKRLLSKHYRIADLCREFPVLVTTFMVFLARYEYNKSFWGFMAETLEIQISPQDRDTFGKCARKAFDSYKFDYSDVKNEKRSNIEPILYEAGRPPESCLDDLFYILKYGSYRVFDPNMIIDDLTEARSYQIRKPMKKFLARSTEDRAVGFVLEIHDAMLAVDRSMSVDSPYVENYIEWKSENEIIGGKSLKRRTVVQAKPFLNFEHGKKGLCMTLPYYVIEEEWLDYVQWSIVCDDKIVTQKEILILGDQGRRYIEPISVAIPPYNKYKISLCGNLDSKKEIAKWEIAGVPDKGVLIFNSTGRIASTKYLPVEYGILILDKDAKIENYQNVDISYQYYPTNNDNYDVVFIEALSRNANITFTDQGKSKTMIARPHIEMSFSGVTLLSLTRFSGNYIFTDIPILHISVDQEDLVSNVEIAIEKRIINIDDYFYNDNTATINLSTIIENTTRQFGAYSVKLYINGRFAQRGEFLLSPKIESNYSALLSWPAQSQRGKNKQLKFAANEAYNIEFKDCVVKKGESQYFVDCNPDIGQIRASIKIEESNSSMSFDIDLPVSPFKLTLIDSNNDIRENITNKPAILGATEVDEKIFWLGIETFNKYSTYKYVIRLRSVDGVIQEENVSLTKQGQGNVNLSVLYDSIRANVLPVMVELVCTDTDESVVIIIVRDLLNFEKRPMYQMSSHLVIS